MGLADIPSFDCTRAEPEGKDQSRAVFPMPKLMQLEQFELLKFTQHDDTKQAHTTSKD